MKRIADYSFHVPGVRRLLSALLVRKLKGLSRKINSIEDALDLAYSFNYLGVSIHPGQVREEIADLLKRVIELKPSIVLEIGTGWGGTFFLWSRAAIRDATIMSIDLHRGAFGGGYPEAKVPFLKSFGDEQQTITLVSADAHHPETLQKIKEYLGERTVDFLFIDGDHTYEGVKRDFEMYSPLVRKKGMIALHDIVEMAPETGVEVSRFWDEIKRTHEYTEIIHDPKQRWAGLGVVHV